MKLHFRTRDIGVENDYPAIGWMPSLPSGAEKLWRKCGPLGAAEYPQIVVAGDGKKWRMYLEGLDSGRTDSPAGVGGRVIRMSLYLEGDKTEAGQIVATLADFIVNFLVDGEQDWFKSAFSDLIKPGDPFNWRRNGTAAQLTAAEAILARLIQHPPQTINAVEMSPGWATGKTKAGAEKFAKICLAILEGRLKGTALSLSSMTLNDLPKARSIDSSILAVMSSRPDERERSFPIPVERESPRPPVKRPGCTPPSGPAETGSPEVDPTHSKLKAFFLAAVALSVTLLVALFIRSCVNGKERPPQTNANDVIIQTNVNTDEFQGKIPGTADAPKR